MDIATKLAREIFKKENPTRNWELVSTRDEIGVDVSADHASESEKQEYLARAHRQILEEAFEAEDTAPHRT